MTIHYHGTPITPREQLLTLAGRHFCVSFADPRDVRVAFFWGNFVGKLEMILLGAALTAARRVWLPVRA